MKNPDLRRRRLLKGGGAALAGLSLGQMADSAHAFPQEPGQERHDVWDADVEGNIQPAPDDPFLASKVTFWETNGHITRRVLIP